MRRWLEVRLDEAPDPFVPWLERYDASEDGAPRAVLEERGVRALRDAMARPGRDREAAFRLLAADGYLTYACEAVLDLDEPEPALRELLRRVATGAA